MGSQPGETVKEPPDEVVTAQEFSALVRELSNWSRWGPEDQRGALHFLTAERIAAATGVVRDGVTVSLSLPLNTTPAIHNPAPADHHMTAPTDLDGGEEPVEFMKDYVGLDYHNDGHTHIDALCHVAYQGRLYNDRPQAAVTGHGAAVNSIEALRDGLVGRDVLLDIPRRRGLPWLEPGEHVFAEDLEAAEREQRVAVGEGDILLVRTGHSRRLAELGPWNTRESKAGLHPTALRFVASRAVAALGSDGNSDTAPSTTEGVDFPIHALAIAAMGLHLLDYLQFEELTVAWRARPALGVPVHRRAFAHRGRDRVADQPPRRVVMSAEYRIKMARVGGMRAWSLDDPPADLHCTWVPGAGMLGASLVHGGDELLWQGAGVPGYARERKFMGIPFLHPWANRLDRFGYEANGHHVVLDRNSPLLLLDDHGLPIHGVLSASRRWVVQEVAADSDRARLVSCLDFDRPELLEAFPFPHRVELAVEVSGGAVQVRTTLTATGSEPVPITFGFHPYFRLPGVPRASWKVVFPVHERLPLDPLMVPTGASEPASPLTGAIGERSWDDEFDGVEPGACFQLSGGGRTIEMHYTEGYPVAQIFAPPGAEYVCIEPMTAVANALEGPDDELQWVPVGEQHSATPDRLPTRRASGAGSQIGAQLARGANCPTSSDSDEDRLKPSVYDLCVLQLRVFGASELIADIANQLERIHGARHVIVSGNGAAGQALVTADLVDDAVDQAVETIKRLGLPLEDVALLRLESIGPAVAPRPESSARCDRHFDRADDDEAQPSVRDGGLLRRQRLIWLPVHLTRAAVADKSWSAPWRSTPRAGTSRQSDRRGGSAGTIAYVAKGVRRASGRGDRCLTKGIACSESLTGRKRTLGWPICWLRIPRILTPRRPPDAGPFEPVSAAA